MDSIENNQASMATLANGREHSEAAEQIQERLTDALDAQFLVIAPSSTVDKRSDKASKDAIAVSQSPDRSNCDTNSHKRPRRTLTKDPPATSCLQTLPYATATTPVRNNQSRDVATTSHAAAKQDGEDKLDDAKLPAQQNHHQDDIDQDTFSSYSYETDHESTISILDSILVRTNDLFRQAQRHSQGITIRHILLWLQDDYSVDLIRQHKDVIRHRLMALVEQRERQLEAEAAAASNGAPPMFPLAAPKEVIELLDSSSDEDDDDDSEEDTKKDNLVNQKTKDDAADNKEDDDDDSVQEERTLTCLEVIQYKFQQAHAANQVICLE